MKKVDLVVFGILNFDYKKTKLSIPFLIEIGY